MKPVALLMVLCCCCMLFACNAFMLGYTQRESNDAYHLVTGNKDNFGDRRIKYSRHFYKNSPLSRFLDQNGDPSFIYEYRTASKCKGIRLFYMLRDSVYVFEQVKKSNLYPVLKETRGLYDYERNAYARLTSSVSSK